MPSKGHPQVTIRLHPEALSRLQSKSHPQGVAGLIRALVYQHIDFPGSDEWDAIEEGGGAQDGP